MLDEYHLRFLSPLERNKEFSDIAEMEHLYTRYMYTIQNTCPHEITRGGVHPHNAKTRTSSILGNVSVKYPEYETGACWICGKEFGWYCPDSPDHICDYGGPDWELHSEYCIYCHQPEERK